MNRTNFELGVQRMYYVFWACVVISGVIGGGIWLFDGDNSKHVADFAVWFLIVVVLPPAIMFSVRWVYRGFLPKTPTN
jgi:hypothetical protein